MNTPEPNAELTPAELITNKIAELPDWRGERLARLRELIHEAAPGIIEEWKWGTAVWSQNGNVVAAATFKDYVKFNFFKGASLPDPAGLFNAGLEAKTSRSIDLHQSDNLSEAALKELLRAAVALNVARGKKK
jgi:hypothetical protein